MKKILCYACMLLLMSACTVEEDVSPASEKCGGSNSHFVPYEQAEQVLNALLSELDGPVTRSIGKRTIKEHYLVGSGIATKSGDAGATDEGQVYFVNFEDDAGFAILSADDRVPPVLAITESGSLRPGQEIDNPGLAIFMANAEGYINRIIQADSTAAGGSISGNVTWIDTALPGEGVIESDWKSDLHITPMLQTQWSQDPPYNFAAPVINGNNTPAGCGPIAVAQMMAYHQFPAQLAGNVLDWPLILKHKSGYSCQCPNHDHTVLSRFIRAVGDYCGAKYGADGTFLIWNGGSVALQKMGYDVPYGFMVYDYNMIERSLRMSLPVFLYGAGIKVQHKGLGLVWWNSYEDGHFWVIDGIWDRYKTYAYYKDHQIYSRHKEEQKLVHCNFGWGGSSDGYYLSGVFNTQSNHGPVTRGEHREGEEDFFQYKLHIAPCVDVPNN